MRRTGFLLLSLLLLALHPAPGLCSAPEAQPDARLQGNSTWPSQWICDGESSPYDYGVYHFRKHLTMEKQPAQYIINISADNRYRLFVNGEPVCWGPARGDLNYWYYETVDIAPYLRQGDNVLAAQVWNLGTVAPAAQITRRTGLVVQGNTPAEDAVNTDNSWKVYRNPAFSPISNLPEAAYMGGLDDIDGTKYPWGWETPGFDDSSWHAASGMASAKTYGAYGGETNWVLIPRDIPLMEETQQRIPAIRRHSGIDKVPAFTDGTHPLTVPANTRCTILLDQTFLTTAYPEMIVSGGRGASIRISYSEALFNKDGKGNRNEIEGRQMHGFSDVLHPDGADGRLFRTLWFKTYRYIQLDIETQNEPLTIDDFYGMYTGYPFEVRGSFTSDDPSLEEIWEVGWRTARLCAHETYFDCPYYEQLQYAGDTRIQALISLYVSGDDRLVRKALRMYDLSRNYEGITTSRYPSHNPQYIPPFSLYWVNMVHDYWMHREDDRFVSEFLPGIQTVISWFTRKIDPQTGILQSKIPHWNFVDWATSWNLGMAPESDRSGSAVTTLQFAAALEDAAELMRHFGETARAQEYENLYKTLTTNVYRQCWDTGKELLRDYIGATTYSQHANIMGILTDAIPAERQQGVFEKVVSDPSLTQTTFYYRFYLIRAMKKVGMADHYVGMLGPWKDMIAMGLTTFAETPEPTRSDCHAWSSSPNYDLLATVCGVEPDAPGFTAVKIEPHMGPLHHISGVVPHPQGDIKVDLKREGEQVLGQIVIPDGLKARFRWQKKELTLKPGLNEIEITAPAPR